MLSSLRIKNLALVAELALEFPAGLVIVTGETGAGKSIILGALNLLLGQRADRTLLRAGADACTVEGLFELRRPNRVLVGLLEAHGVEPCEDGQLTLKRSFTAAGANRQFINGSPVPLSLLAEIGEWLVDIHGPHDHQSLLDTGRQRDVLDAYAGTETAVTRFGELVRQRAELVQEKEGLVMDEQVYRQQLDLLRHQFQEIGAARLDPAEEADLETRYRRASQSVRLLELVQGSLNALGEEELSITAQARSVGRSLQELVRLDPSAEPFLRLHEQALQSLGELQTELAGYADGIEVDPAQLQEWQARLDLLQSLKRKYGRTLPEVLAFLEEARRRLQQLESREVEMARLNAELAKQDALILKEGRRLSEQRRQAIPKLRKAVVEQLRQLGFPQSHFEIALSLLGGEHPDPAAAPAHGLDQVEFLFAPNPGEPPRPLRQIASSGEMARVMLALKTVLAVQDNVPVLIFDEVDANIGGETARMVGVKMREIARHRQVFCITHLAPVAAAAQAHYLVTKRIEDGRTFSSMKPIEHRDRVTELARMLGGQSDAARRHAEALLAGSDK